MRKISGLINADVFDEAVWLQERQAIFVTDVQISTGETLETTFVALLDNEYNLVARYAVNTLGMAYIDVTDLLRYLHRATRSTAMSVYVARYNGNADETDHWQEIPFRFVGLISPAKLFIPHLAEVDYLANYERTAQTYFAPPQMILAPTKSTENLRVFLCNIDCWIEYNVSQTRAHSSPSPIAPIPEPIELDANVEKITLYRYQDTDFPCITRQVRSLECGKEYVMVEWQPAFGVLDDRELKKATWEVQGHTISAETVALSPRVIYNFEDIKSREDTIMLVLRGLTRFDLWYYSDIITSSEVIVHFDTYDATVRVESSEIAIPDGNAGGLQTLKVKVKVVKYDAFRV